MSRIACAICSILLLAAAVTGCGGGGEGTPDQTDGATGVGASTSTTTPSSDDSADKPEKGAWGVAFAAEGEDLGLILYDLSGHTLYTSSNDKGTTSSCYGACAKAWPPALTEGKPDARGGASAAKIGATKRRDGTVQLTYAGHPLYTYTGDKSSETNGNGAHAFGGDWYAIRPNGERPGN